MIIENLTRDSECRVLDNTGRYVCNFTVTVNRRSDRGYPEADYFRVACWDEQGKACLKYLSKGKKVAVIGRVSASPYIDKEGKARANLELVAQEVEFLTPRGAEGGEPEAQAEEADAAAGFVKVDDEELPF